MMHSQPSGWIALTLIALFSGTTSVNLVAAPHQKLTPPEPAAEHVTNGEPVVGGTENSTGDVNEADSLPTIVHASGRPASGLKVHLRGLYWDTLQTDERGHFGLWTDDKGRFEFSAESYPLFLFVSDPEHSEVGGAVVTHDGQIPRIVLGPATTVSGRLLDHKTSAPIAGAWVECSIQKMTYSQDERYPGNKLGHTTVRNALAIGSTSGDGTFEIPDVIPGQLYHVTVWHGMTNPKLIEADIRGELLTIIRAPQGKSFEVGDVYSRTRERSGQEREDLPSADSGATSAWDLREFYRSPDDFEKLLPQILADSSVLGQHVAVVTAGPLQSEAREMADGIFAEDSFYAASNGFQILGADRTDGDSVLKTATISTWLRNGGLPEYFRGISLFTSKGQFLSSATPSDLKNDTRIDPDKVTDFLAKHAPAAPEVNSLIRDAGEIARTDSKRIILYSFMDVQETIPLRFLPDDQRAILEKEFVLMPVHVRSESTHRQLEELCGFPWRRWSSGWIGILSADGTLLASSMMPEGSNMGLPRNHAGREWFRTMLASTAVRLSPQEIDLVISGIAAKNVIDRPTSTDE